MPAWLGQMAGQIGSQAAGGAMGILAQRLGKNYDRKQWVKDWQNQFPYMMEGERAMMDLQSKQQYDMWLKTGIGGQMAEMKKAGVNPALLLGMSGSGGATVGGGAPSMPNISGTSGSTGNNVIGGGMGILTGAQVKLMEAQARNLNVDSDKKAGVDTDNVKADTGLKLANTGNVSADTELKQIEKRIKLIDESIKTETKNDVIDRIFWETKKSMEQVENLRWSNDLNKEQFDTQVKLIKAELIGKYIENQLRKEEVRTEHYRGTNEMEKQPLIRQQIRAMVNDIETEWRGLDLEDKKIMIQEKLNLRQEDRKDIEMIINGIDKIMDYDAKTKKPHSSTDQEENYTEYDNDGNKREYKWKRRKY